MPVLPSPADRQTAWSGTRLHEPGWPLLAAGLGAGVGGTLVEAAAAVAAAVSVAAGALLATRRLAGALPPAPVPAAAVAVTCAGVLLIVVADRGRRRGLLEPVAARGGLLLATLTLAVPTITRGESWLAGTTGIGGWALTLLALVASAGIALRLPTGRTEAGHRRPPRSERMARGRRAAPRIPAFADVETSRQRTGSPAAVRACPGRLRQEQQRYEPAPDSDCVRGRLMLSLAAGAKTAHGHVGFCPAFGETPRVQVTTDYDGVEAVVAAAEVLPWGVRLECRLAEPAEEPLDIPVDFLAEARL
jgi:hypothetical protein